MNFEFKIKTVLNNYLTIKTENEKVIEHFKNPKNYTEIILEQINTENLYQKWLADKKDVNILDFGGNVGLFALHVTDIAKKIVSVEPTPEHIMILKELTKDYKNIKVVESALNDKDEMVPFFIDPWNSTTNSLRRENSHYLYSSLISGKTLKTILDENDLDEVEFAKIDIEGSEYKALTKDTINATEKRIKSWFVEAHNSTNLPSKEGVKYLANIFKQCGYSDIEIFGVNLDQMIVRA